MTPARRPAQAIDRGGSDMAVKTGSVPAKAAAKSTAKATAKPKDVMAFSFADTIAGYVKRYDRNADSFTMRDERRPGVHGRADRHDRRPDRAQPRRAVRRCHRPDARHARARALPVHLRGLLSPGRDARLRRQDADVPGRPCPRLRPREAGLVGQADLPDGRLLLPLAVRRRRAELARVPGRHRHDRQQGRRPPGDRHDLAPHLRPLERVPDDRRGSLPQGLPRPASSTCASTCATTTRARASPTGTTPSRSTSRARRRSSPRSSATTTRRSRPTSRSTRWSARPSCSGSTAIRRSRKTSTRRSRCSSGSSTTPSTAATGRTSTRSRSTARATPSAATGRARTGTRSAITCRPT